MDYIVNLGLAGVLIATIFFDLRQMKIPNVLSLILLALFVLSVFTLSSGEIGIRLVQAAVVFAIGFFAFMFHLIGGGDVKILAALMLFVPVHHMAVIMLIFSASLVVGVTLIVLSRRFIKTKESNWAFIETAKMPMGVPIGFAGLIALSASGLN